MFVHMYVKMDFSKQLFLSHSGFISMCKIKIAIQNIKQTTVPCSEQLSKYGTCYLNS